MTNISKTKSPSLKVYFGNLNAIRFIAASLVIVHHIEQIKGLFHIPNYWNNNVIVIIGKLGVVLFFVLSGFLISYLLFKEQEVTKTISVKHFYLRRILRIWPLYFLILFSAFFIFPFINFFTIEGFEKNVVWDNLFYKLILYILFLPNLVINLLSIVPYVSHAWSIGAEEQFYLVWPILNKKFKNKWVLMFGVIFIYLGIKFLVPHFISSYKYRSIFIGFWSYAPIDCMAIGGLFALIVHQTTSFARFIKKILFNKLVQWFILLVTVLLILKGIEIPYFHYEVYSVLFGILICNFAANKQIIFSMEYSWLSYLGKISYGLYMFHPIAIVFSIKLLQKFDLMSNIVLYPLTMITVILISAISYEVFEKKFINKKIKYSKLLSGDHAKEKLLPTTTVLTHAKH